MKLPVGFSPIKVVQAVGFSGNASFTRTIDRGWVGTVRKNDGTGQLLVEELETSWKVTDVYAETSQEGVDLEQLLKDVLK